MDKISKFLQKLSLKEREIILTLLEKIILWSIDDLDCKKLVWEDSLYRVRKWKIRIIFSKVWDKIKIVDVNFRWQIYKKNN